jgi:TonB family protein
LKAEYQPIVEEGIADLKRALEIDPQYDDAMAYMNLLIREWADTRDTPAEYARDIGEANDWVDKTMAVKRAKAEARNSGLVAPAPPPSGQGGGGGDRAVPQRIRIAGNDMAAKVIRQDPPVYPESAQRAGISGSVTLAVVVGRDGGVHKVEPLSGPPELQKAAVDAVKQWVYKPTLLNNEPVEVETTVTVQFSLQ